MLVVLDLVLQAHLEGDPIGEHKQGQLLAQEVSDRSQQVPVQFQEASSHRFRNHCIVKVDDLLVIILKGQVQAVLS